MAGHIRLFEQQAEMIKRLDAIENHLNNLVYKTARLIDQTKRQRWAILANTEAELANQQTLDRLVTSTTANTNATKAAHDALIFYASSNAELIAKLNEAIQAAGLDDTDAIVKAAEAIEANNASLIEATPKVADAITAGTPAASPQPA